MNNSFCKINRGSDFYPRRRTIAGCELSRYHGTIWPSKWHVCVGEVTCQRRDHLAGEMAYRRLIREGVMSHMMSVGRVAAKPPIRFLLFRLFPSSGVAGMVMNIILQLCTSTSAPFNPHFPYLFYTSLPIWFSVFLYVCFLVLMHLTIILAAKSVSPKNVTIDWPTVFRKPRTVVAIASYSKQLHMRC